MGEFIKESVDLGLGPDVDAAGRFVHDEALGLHGQASRPTNIEGRAGEEDFYRDAAASFAGSDCAPHSQELSV